MAAVFSVVAAALVATLTACLSPSSGPAPAPITAAVAAVVDCKALPLEQPQFEATPRWRVTLPPPTAASRAGIATMRIVTNLGDIAVEFDRSKTPCTAAFLEFLAANKYYDNSSCHRLTTAGIHVLQCGDPTGTSRGGPGFRYTEENVLRPTPASTAGCMGLPSGLPKEFFPTAFPSVGITHINLPTSFPSSQVCFNGRGDDPLAEPENMTYPRGTLAMAKASDWDTTGSQFFFTYRDVVLPGAYTPFGKVVKGIDILDQVAAGGVADGGQDGNPKIALRLISVQIG